MSSYIRYSSAEAGKKKKKKKKEKPTSTVCKLFILGVVKKIFNAINVIIQLLRHRFFFIFHTNLLDCLFIFVSATTSLLLPDFSNLTISSGLFTEYSDRFST